VTAAASSWESAANGHAASSGGGAMEMKPAKITSANEYS